MALRTIGSPSADFGTGDSDLLQKEVMVEPRVNEPLVNYEGTVVAHLVAGQHTVTKEVRSGSLSDLNPFNPLSGGVTKYTARASNEDFVKVETETEVYE